MASSFLDKTGLGLVWAQIKLLLANKVDKVDGKGLSSNDYTADEKAKLANIAAGAEVNVNADWNAVTGDAAILNKPTIPTATSDLTNDSGYITVNDVPEGAAASTTTPAMDGTASVGTETAFARGDHVHPSDTSKVDKVAGKGLSTEDFTTAEKTKLSGIEAGAQANVNADWNAASGDAQILNKPTIPTVGSVIDYSTNAVESQAIYEAFDKHIQNAIEYNSDYPSTAEDLMKYTYITYYVQSLDDAVKLYRTQYGVFSSIDGKYMIEYDDQDDTWTYSETGSSQTFSLSHVNEGFYPNYVLLDDYYGDKNRLYKILSYNMVGTVPDSFDDLDGADAIMLYDASIDTSIYLFNTWNNHFYSIYDGLDGTRTYHVYKNGSTWMWQRWQGYSDVSGDNLQLNNVTVLKYKYALPQDIPTNNNQLTNGAGYQTAANVNSLIATAIGDLEGVSFEIVQTLPATGDKSKIYLVPLTDTDTDNIYEEYIWITSASDYEKIGTTSVDLSDYYNTTNLVPITSSEINTICQ